MVTIVPRSFSMYATARSNLLAEFKSSSIRLPSCWMNIISTSRWPGKGCWVFFSVAGSVWHTVAFYVMFRHTRGGALSVCDHRITIPLLWCDTLSVTRVHGPSVTSACKAFLRNLSLGKFSSASQVSYVSCVAHYWHCLFAFTKKQIAVGPCQKSGEAAMLW